ncbi:MAG: alpha/beta hydrolase [Pseudomonadota bacterium]|nr:alpha/beta hydrolase [Pseudomonadota bacterium]
MRLEVAGAQAYASTGGRPHVPGRPWIIFLHGAGGNHLTWLQQSRALAYDGWNVLAPDLPGHTLSEGLPIGDIAGQARWVLALMDEAGAESAVLVGHSMGGLVMLELARMAPKRVDGMVIIASAAAIPVNRNLIDMADTAEDTAILAMTSWALGPDAIVNDNNWPGGAHAGAGIRFMHQNHEGVLSVDLKACAAYADGIDAAGKVACPTLCILAGLDRMTPPKNGKALADALAASETLVIEGAGHTLPAERPRQVNAAIRDFLERRVPKKA